MAHDRGQSAEGRGQKRRWAAAVFCALPSALCALLLATTAPAEAKELDVRHNETSARELIVRSFAEDIERIDQQDLLFSDFKTALQEVAQGRGLQLPEYNVVGEVGPDHDKTFIVEVKIGSLTARGEGSSKKEAQQQAARTALQEFAAKYGA